MPRSRRRVRWRVVLACLVAALSVSAVMPVPSVGVPAAGGEQEVAPISWGACPPGSLDKVPELLRPLFSCATYPVPMDHADPSRGTVPLALMRRTAVHPEQRIGSLFVNFGGPGVPRPPRWGM